MNPTFCSICFVEIFPVLLLSYHYMIIGVCFSEAGACRKMRNPNDVYKKEASINYYRRLST